MFTYIFADGLKLKTVAKCIENIVSTKLIYLLNKPEMVLISKEWFQSKYFKWTKIYKIMNYQRFIKSCYVWLESFALCLTIHLSTAKIAGLILLSIMKDIAIVCITIHYIQNAIIG